MREGTNWPALAATSAKSGSIQEKSGRSSSTPMDSSRAPHIATVPVAAPTAKSGSLMRPSEVALRAMKPLFIRAPPRSRISLPANSDPARNSGIT